MHIRGYLKRKEQKDEIWREVFRELNKPDKDTPGQGINFEGQVVKLPGTPNTQPHIEKLPLMQEESGHPPVKLDYAKRAAAGWARFKADTDRQQMLLRDPNYQKWQKAMGTAAQDDADQYPKSNWNFSQNNQFGYLYNRNPEEAKRFAKLVNAEYSNTPTMISEAAAMGEEAVAVDMGLLGDIKESGGILGYIGEIFQKDADLQASNSGAALEKGLKDAQTFQDILDSAGELETANANVGKQLGDNMAGGIKDAVGSTANAGGNLAGAQANVGKMTADTVVEEVPEILNAIVPQPAEPPKPISGPVVIPLTQIGLLGTEPKKDPVLLTPMEAMLGKPGDYEEKAALGFQQWKGDHNDRLNIENSDGYQAYIDFMTKNNNAATPEGMAAAQKILGPGNTIEEPQPNWTAAENNQFGYLYYTDPAAAAAYARNVNTQYAVEEEQKTDEWAENHQVLAQVSTWVTDRLGLPEMLNSELHYAQYGQLPYTWQVTPSRHSELVRDTMKEDVLGNDSVDGWVYDALDSSGDAAYQAYLMKLWGNPVGGAIGAMEGYSDAYNWAMREALALGMTDEQAVAYAREMAKAKLGGHIASFTMGEFLPQGNDVKTSMIREGVSNMVDGGVRNGLSIADRYDGLVAENLENGMTAEEADYWAKWQVMQEFGTSALYDLSIGLAYGLGRSDNSVKRSLFRK